MLTSTFLLLTAFGLAVCEETEFVYNVRNSSIVQMGQKIKWDTIMGNQSQYSVGSGRIVGGGDTTIEQYPHQVRLEYTYNYQGWYFFCGASIIGDRWILTAAHCVDGWPDEWHRIVAGSSSLSEYFQVRYVTKYWKHPDYCVTNDGYEHDIAILKLAEPLVFGPKVNKIDIAKDNEDFAGMKCNITGWGRLYGFGPLPDILQEAVIPVISNEECGDVWNVFYGATISKNHICVNGDSKSSCNGDSGGPMTCMDRGSRVLAGVTSWGYFGCDVNYPSVYVRVSKYKSFINKITNSNKHK